MVSAEILQKICDVIVTEIGVDKHHHMLVCLKKHPDAVIKWVDMNIRQWATPVALEVGQILIFDHHGLLAHKVVDHLKTMFTKELADIK